MTKTTDVTIVGSGLAGLYTALMIDPRYKIEIFIKNTLFDSNSNLAQGGIAGEMSLNRVNLQNHIEDTLKAGSYLNDLEKVKVLIAEAKENIDNLINFGVDFDKDSNGNIKFTREGGHSTYRILHSGGDATGSEIMKALKIIVQNRENIIIHENTIVTDLICDNSTVNGIFYINKNNNLDYLISKKTIIATGGIGSLYGATTNSLQATGDGIGMAYRSGAKINNMEFIQFHPTGLFLEDSKSRQHFLISEAVRGEGAYLVNIENERFMVKYSDLMELAPRDKVSQSIFREMYDTWTDHVYLDTRHLDTKKLEKRFPTIFNKCKSYGLIMGIDLIPVAPVEHFAIGGISTDFNGKTNIENLYANGECADTGVHGANRLASNSLLECVVFGNRIAKDINNTSLELVNFVEKPDIPTIRKYQYNYKPTRKKIGNLMDEFAGIVRTQSGLSQAKLSLDEIYNNLKKYPNISKNYFETLNMTTTARIIVENALERTDSIGCHYRINDEK